MSLRTLNIDFQRGSTIDGFADTVKFIFDMMDSRFVPTQEAETPYVKVKIAEGFDGLRRFVALV